MKVIAIISARYDSVRFPEKALVNILGKPIIHHVHERASEYARRFRTCIASDD